MNAKEFQAALHDLAFELGAESNRLFLESYLEDWPNEEATTGALFGALVQSIRAMSKAGSTTSGRGITLKAQLTTKPDEAEHGADVIVRFECDEPQWQIRTTTVIQAKRLDFDQSMTSGDHGRLADQLDKMLAYTTESFVLVYEKQGIHAIPAVAAKSLRTRKLFDIETISWQWFLSGIFRGRMGETNPTRLPGKPRIEVTIVAEATKAAPLSRTMTAG